MKGGRLSGSWVFAAPRLSSRRRISKRSVRVARHPGLIGAADCESGRNADSRRRLQPANEPGAGHLPVALNSNDRDAQSPGDKFGPYELLAPAGAGGMGEVWKARDTRLDRIVTLKFSQENFSERFEREAKAAGALKASRSFLPLVRARCVKRLPIGTRAR